MSRTGPPSGAHPDRRVRRTRAAIHAALIELSLAHGYEAVTVEQLTARADVARATLYAHYPDKRAVLDAITDDVVDELLGELEAASPTSHAVVVRTAFRHAERHCDAYRLLLSGAGDSGPRTRLLSLAAEFGETMIARVAGERGLRPRLPADAVARLWSGQLINAMAWVVSGQCPYSAAELAEMLVRLRFYGLAWAYGLEPADPRMAEEAGRDPP